MRITLNQEEIEEAIEKLILDQVDVPDDMRIDIDLKATRGDEGYTAEIDILPYDAPTDGTDRSVDPRINVCDGAEGMSIAEKTEEAIIEANKPRRRGRPSGAKNKPKPHRREVETDQDQDQEPDADTDVDTDVDVEPNMDDDNSEVSSDITEDAEEQPEDEVESDVESESESEAEAEVEPEPEPEPDEVSVDVHPVEEESAPVQEENEEAAEEVNEEAEVEPSEPTPPSTTPTRSLFANVQRRDNSN